MNRSSLYFTGEQSVDLREGQLREREDEVLIETQVSAISPGTELLIYNELTLSEIAWKLNYSSVAHLSNQFKQITGFAPTAFKKLQHKERKSLDQL